MAVRMNPYLVMDGNAREAVAFYQKALEATLASMQTFGEMPADPNRPTPEHVKDRILHALLKVGETELMFSDTFPGMPYHVGNHVTISLVSDDIGRSQRMFKALAEGGRINMPMQETFWSPAYGQVTDRFGVVWQVSTETGQA